MPDDLTPQQLEMIGLERARRVAAIGSKAQRTRASRRTETLHDLLSGLPSQDDLSFLHSGLCQTCLPHAKPASNQDYWQRSSGRFTLVIAPGILPSTPLAAGRQPTPRERAASYVGVPYGSKARLIMFYLQTEGMRSRTVTLGPNLSAFLRSLGLPVSGGPRGSIAAVREQCLRIARCTFTMQWSDVGDGGARMTISDTKIVDGLELWRAERDNWTGTVELTSKFHDHLRAHAVPLDKRGIALLSGNSLGLDLYALFAYRLPRLRQELHLPWGHLREQIGTQNQQNKLLARKVRAVLPTVMQAYPHAKVGVTSTGITMRPSLPAVPQTSVQGFRLVETQPAGQTQSSIVSP